MEVSAKSAMKCKMCGRTLNQPGEPLSVNCGGDCWSCIGEVEANLGHEPSLSKVMEEAAAGLRPGWKKPLENTRC